MMTKLPEDNYLNSLLLRLESEGTVSDIHLKSGYKIYCRIMGDITELEYTEVLNSNKILEFLQPILSNTIKQQYQDTLQADFAFNTSNGTRYRANLYKTNKGISLALRRINNKINSFEELNAPLIMKKIANLKKGLVIISGPTGSGKSTTLNSFIDYINNSQKKHIITVEDPIEYIYENNLSLIEQREIGNDAKSFDSAIISSLREDPDIILIGEMRDSKTIKECLMAAETGHLVFTTLHTQTAAKTVDRIIDSCEAEEKELVRSMLSTSLQAVILQKLLKKADGTGMIAAFEVLVANNAVRNLIKENKINQIDSVIQTSSKFGMVDMKSSIENLYKMGVITSDEMNSVLINLNDTDSNFVVNNGNLPRDLI